MFFYMFDKVPGRYDLDLLSNRNELMKKLFCKDIQFVYKRIRKRVPIKHKNRRRIKISNSFCFVNVIIDSVEIKIWVNFFIFCKILVFSAESFTSMTVL